MRKPRRAAHIERVSRTAGPAPGAGWRRNAERTKSTVRRAGKFLRYAVATGSRDLTRRVGINLNDRLQLRRAFEILPSIAVVTGLVDVNRPCVPARLGVAVDFQEGDGGPAQRTAAMAPPRRLAPYPRNYFFESGICFQCRGTFFTSIMTSPNSITRARNCLTSTPLGRRPPSWLAKLCKAQTAISSKPGREWRMEVTDEFANPLYVVHINAERAK